MQIGGINIDKRYMIVFIGIILVISAIVGFSYIYSDLNYSARVTAKKTQCNQDSLYDRLQCMATLDSISSKYVSDSNGIRFNAISSSTNGRGIYAYSESMNYTYPIYYYRGAVTNNNALFAGFCWKIVRTTDTGGVKLLYNGTPNGSGQCKNTTGSATRLSSKSAFNTNDNSPAYNGYMYGNVYTTQTGSTSTSHIYGNTFTYAGGTYTLSDAHNGLDSTHHYTCFNDTGTCSNLFFVYFIGSDNTTVHYITLTGGKDAETALREMQVNTNNSTIKNTVDNWFNNTFKNYFTTNGIDYHDYLEDTVWCNDRSMNTIITSTYVGDSSVNNGWISNGGNPKNPLWYSAYGRWEKGLPSLSCSNKNDAFTVEESATGNGALTYPVGLLTADEIILAGGQNGQNTDYYLNTNEELWTLSPYNFNFDDVPYNFHIFGSPFFGALANNPINVSKGVRPSISLKPTIKLAPLGDGTEDAPYQFVAEEPEIIEPEEPDEPKESEMINLVKDTAINDSRLNFKKISYSAVIYETNGNGLFVRNGTQDNTYPIYYYRGEVTNNNAKFAGFCWKIVRTTETGGTKLIYNGTPNASGGCTNTTEDATQIGTSAINTSRNSLSSVGYMYGKVYDAKSLQTSTSHLYGNSFTYSNGTYTLKNTHSGGDNTHHYTCFNSTGTCSSVSYVININTTYAYYISLKDGESVEDAINNMNTNTNNSVAKTAIDNWFKNTFRTYFINRNKDYNDYLEDTIWCNDRTTNKKQIENEYNIDYVNNGWNPNGGSMSQDLYFNTNSKMTTGTPDLICPNKNDSFTVEESATGNGKLTYPVGLLTADEILLAGGQNYSNTHYYLCNNKLWWILSPSEFYNIYNMHMCVGSAGTLTQCQPNNSYGIRPSISLKPEVRIASGGDGTSATPYEFVVE